MWVGTEESEKELKDSFIDFPQIKQMLEIII